MMLAKALCAALVSFVVISSASASDFSRTPPPKQPPAGVYQGGGRTGGDTVADATVIPSLPFSDTGSTCGFANDYDEVCPYTGSTAPDVVYSYMPAMYETTVIDLCAADYDSKVYVWKDTPGNVVACNDDSDCGYSGWQSRILNFVFEPGHSYWIVIDGYGPSCGDYSLLVGQIPPCVVECPPGALQEGEPPCQDGYIDHYNGGCQTESWTPIPAQAGGCATMCGKSCTYLVQGLSYRDSDWYTATAIGGLVTMDCVAEFPLQLILIYNSDCANMQYVIDTADPCETAHVEHVCQAGQVVWPWVGPSVFQGIPESDYVLDLCGISTETDPLGACCFVSGCWVAPQSTCPGFWHGPGLDCDPDPCVGPSGACCLPDGSCEVIGEGGCIQWEGTWYTGQDCDPSPCQPTPVQEGTWGRIKSSYR